MEETNPQSQKKERVKEAEAESEYVIRLRATMRSACSASRRARARAHLGAFPDPRLKVELRTGGLHEIGGKSSFVSTVSVQPSTTVGWQYRSI